MLFFAFRYFHAKMLSLFSFMKKDLASEKPNLFLQHNNCDSFLRHQYAEAFDDSAQANGIINSGFGSAMLFYGSLV